MKKSTDISDMIICRYFMQEFRSIHDSHYVRFENAHVFHAARAHPENSENDRKKHSQLKNNLNKYISKCVAHACLLISCNAQVLMA